MKLQKIYLLLILLLIANGCGENNSKGGEPSSFNESNSSPVIDNFEIENEDKENIILINSSEVNISVRENTREAFKVNASDRSTLTYYLTEGDFNELYIDQKTGETFFKKATNYERKSSYNFKIIVQDSVGHETQQQVYIKVEDNKNETAPIASIDLNRTLNEEEKNYFITTWRTVNPGISNNNQIIIPTAGDGYNYSVDWGDGSSSKQLTADAKHTYKESGTYKVKIVGHFPRIYFGQNVDYDLSTYENDSRKVISINQWGTNVWQSMAGAFTECAVIEGNASDIPNLSQVKDMSTMFALSSFNQDISNWDMSNVENLKMMFFFSAFKENISNWDTSKVTNMVGLFGLTQFNQDISKWDTSQVKSMAGMFFSNTSFNQDIGGWDVSSVTDMSLMFSLANAFNQNISAWDTSNVRFMIGMFLGASSFNQDISKWDLSKVTDMSQMFQSATSFNQNLEPWNISTETNTSEIFTATDAFFALPTWYSVDKDIKKRAFIVIAQNVDIRLCTVTSINKGIDQNRFKFQQEIDRSTIIASSKKTNLGCEEYGREDQLIDCTIIDMKQKKGESCVIGFNVKESKPKKK